MVLKKEAKPELHLQRRSYLGILPVIRPIGIAQSQKPRVHRYWLPIRADAQPISPARHPAIHARVHHVVEIQKVEKLDGKLEPPCLAEPKVSQDPHIVVDHLSIAE